MTDDSLKGRNLRSLKLANTRATDDGLTHLKGCIPLRQLSLDGSAATYVGLKL